MFKVGDKVRLNDEGKVFAIMFCNKNVKYLDSVAEIVEIIEESFGGHKYNSYVTMFPKGFFGNNGNGFTKEVYKDNNVLFLPIEDIELVNEDEVEQKEDAVGEVIDDVEKLIDQLTKMLTTTTKKESNTNSNDVVKFKPYIESCFVNGAKTFRGYIGEETKMVDCNNSKLHIGDIVMVENELRYTCVTYVGFDDIDKNIVMGIGGCCGRDGEIKDFKVTKLIDHSIAHNYTNILEIPMAKVKYIVKEDDK